MERKCQIGDADGAIYGLGFIGAAIFFISHLCYNKYRKLYIRGNN